MSFARMQANIKENKKAFHGNPYVHHNCANLALSTICNMLPNKRPHYCWLAYSLCYWISSICYSPGPAPRHRSPLSPHTTTHWSLINSETIFFVLRASCTQYTFSGIDSTNEKIWAKQMGRERQVQLTGHPSATFFKLLSLILTHDSKLIAVNFEQCLLIAYMAWSVIFLQSDRSSRSILWQCWASVLRRQKKRRKILPSLKYSSTNEKDESTWSIDHQPIGILEVTSISKIHHIFEKYFRSLAPEKATK